MGGFLEGLRKSSTIKRNKIAADSDLVVHREGTTEVVVNNFQNMINKPNPDKVMCSLVRQVSKATPRNGNEVDVRTCISQPMWDLFCKATGIPIGTKPTEWIGIKDTCRVFGSETIILDRRDYISWSETIVKR